MNHEEEPLLIERQYPTKKQEKIYPLRYDNSIFEKLNEMIDDIELQNDYTKLKIGKNYKTNRKITIEGKIYKKLKERFMIKYRGRSVIFEDLIGINSNEYLQETEKINNKINLENALIKDYNKSIDIIIEKIQKLKRWDDFIEFEGKKYGLINKIKNNIHIENNCLGEMMFTSKETEYTVNDRPFCNYDDKDTTYLIYKCVNCNYEEKRLNIYLAEVTNMYQNLDFGGNK
jgi:hypothetical protein